MIDMKKIFIYPEIDTMELSAGNEIMVSEDLTRANSVTYADGFSDDTSADLNSAYKVWRGFNNSNNSI